MLRAVRALRCAGAAERAGVAVRRLERWPRTIAGRAMDTYHRWMEVTIYATFAGLPAISVPAGFDAARRLPMGLQLIGRPHGDAALLPPRSGLRITDRTRTRTPPASALMQTPVAARSRSGILLVLAIRSVASSTVHRNLRDRRAELQHDVAVRSHLDGRRIAGELRDRAAVDDVDLVSATPSPATSLVVSGCPRPRRTVRG